MGETGSHSANASPSQPPPCESESVPGLLSLPMEILLLIIDCLPRRSLRNVRLVCRKLETAAEVRMNRICIWLEGQPRSQETHHLLRCDRLSQSMVVGAVSQVSAHTARAQRVPKPTANNIPPVEPPGWAAYVKDLHLCLRTEPPPDLPQPHPGQRKTVLVPGQGQGGAGGELHLNLDVQLDMGAGGAPDAAHAALQILPPHVQLQVELLGQNVIVHAQQIGQNHVAGQAQPEAAAAPPQQPQQQLQQPQDIPVVMAWAQHVADQVHELLQLAAQAPGNVAVGEQAQVEAILTAAAGLPPPASSVLHPMNVPQEAQVQGQQEAMVMEVAEEPGPGVMPPPQQQQQQQQQVEPQLATQLRQQAQPNQEQRLPVEAPPALGPTPSAAVPVRGAGVSSRGLTGLDLQHAIAEGPSSAGGTLVPVSQQQQEQDLDDSEARAGTVFPSTTSAAPYFNSNCPEAVLNAKLASLTSNLVPYLHRLRVLSLDHVPRHCMAATGELTAAATGVTELHVGRADSSEQPDQLAQPQLELAEAGGDGDGFMPGGLHNGHHHHDHIHLDLLQEPLQHLQAAQLQIQLHAAHHLNQLQHHLHGFQNLFDPPNPEHGDFPMADALQLGPDGGNGGGGGGIDNGGGGGAEELMDQGEDAGPGEDAAPPADWLDWTPLQSPRLELDPEQRARGQAAELQEQPLGEEEGGARGSGGGGALAAQVDGDTFMAQQQQESGPGQLRSAVADAPSGPGPSGSRTAVTVGDGGGNRAPAPERRNGVGRPGRDGAGAGADGEGGGGVGEVGAEGAGPSGRAGVAAAASVSGTVGTSGTSDGAIMDWHQSDVELGPEANIQPDEAHAEGGFSDGGASGSGAGDHIHNHNEDNHLGGGGNEGGGGVQGNDMIATAGNGTGGSGEADEEELEEGEQLFWSRVAALPKLRTLVLRGGQLRAADMAGLVALTGLQELVVNHVVNVHPGLACLASLSGLTRLVIEDLQYAGGAIHDEFCGLSRLTNLRSLSFLVVGPLPAEVMAWGALSQLTQLEITNHYDDNLLPCFWTVLPRLPHLRALNLSNFEINNSLLVALRPCTQLSSLQMGRINLSAPCGEVLPAVRQLHLAFVDDLQHTEVPLVSVFPLLDDLALQTRYVLSHDSAQRIPRELLGGGATDNALLVTRLHLYDALMSPLVPAAIPGLTSLRLDWNQIDTITLVSYMSQWGSSLTRLTWCNCDTMRDWGVEALSRALPRLGQLELVRCVAITDVGLGALTALTALTSLTVASSPELTASGFSTVVSALPFLEQLTLRDIPGLTVADCTALENQCRRRGGLVVDMVP